MAEAGWRWTMALNRQCGIEDVSASIAALTPPHDLGGPVSTTARPAPGKAPASDSQHRATLTRIAVGVDSYPEGRDAIALGQAIAQAVGAYLLLSGPRRKYDDIRAASGGVWLCPRSLTWQGHAATPASAPGTVGDHSRCRRTYEANH